MAQKKVGARKKLLNYLLNNIGVVLNSEQLREVAGTSEWGRRIRELRDEYGYQIVTHNDRSDLSPGQYMLTSADQIEASTRAISKETRARVLDMYGSLCYTCGAVAGEPHETNGKVTSLQMGHVVPRSMGGLDDVSNLRPQCMVCNTGAANLSTELPTSKRLIAELRKAPRTEQRLVLDWLATKFKD